MSLSILNKPLRIMPAMPQRPPQANIPQTLAEREHLRAIVVRHVDERRETLVPPLVVDELRDQAEAVVARAGVDPVYRDYVGVLINNEVWSEQLASVPFDRRLLLLPKCMRVEDKCPAPFDEFGLLCKQCGLCTIQDLQEEAERLGYAVLVAEGSALVMALIQSGKIDAIVGVSCLSVLERAFPYMEAAAIPGVAIPLLQDDCKDTAVDIDWVWSVVHLTSDDRTRRLDLDALRTGGRDLVHARRARRRARPGGRRSGSRRQKLAGRRGQTVAAVSDRVRVQGAAGRSGAAAPRIAPQGRRRRRVLSQGLARARRHRGRGRAALWTGHASRRTWRARGPQRRRPAGRRRLPIARGLRRPGRRVRGAGPHRRRGTSRALHRTGRGARLDAPAGAAHGRSARWTSSAARRRRPFRWRWGSAPRWRARQRPRSRCCETTARRWGSPIRFATISRTCRTRTPSRGLGLGAPSLLLALACDKAKAAGRDRVMTLWRGRRTSPADRAAFLALLGEMGVEDRARALLEAYKEQAIRTLPALQNASLKGLLRRVVGKVFRVEIKGWCSEFETRDAAGRPAGAEAAR